MFRRFVRIILVVPLLAAALAAGAAAAADPADYKKDVEFLLDELKRRAGHFFKRKGVDWGKVEKRFRKEVKGVTSDVEHFQLCRRLLANLKDGHAAVNEVHFEWPADQKPPERKGIGMSLTVAGRKVFVKECYGPAAAAGIQPGYEVREIDETPALKWLEARAAELGDEDGFSTAHAALYAACHQGLAGPPGRRFTFELKEGKGGGTTKKTLTCAGGGGSGVPSGQVFPPQAAQGVGRQSHALLESGYGWIHLRDVPGELPAQLDQMLAALNDPPGLILDFRANGGGGVDHDAVIGRFLGAGEALGPFRGGNEGAHYRGPMVVIVDAGSRSAAETVSGYLKESGRAYMIGPTPTAGMSGQKETLTLPSGLMTVLITVKSHHAGRGGGPEIEGVGVEPHEVVEMSGELLEAGIDPLVHRAEEILRAGASGPLGKNVRYRGD